MEESAVHKDYPYASIDLLLAIIPREQLALWERDLLHDILDKMKEKHADVETNPKFVTLYRRANA